MRGGIGEGVASGWCGGHLGQSSSSLWTRAAPTGTRGPQSRCRPGIPRRVSRRRSLAVGSWPA